MSHQLYASLPAAAASYMNKGWLCVIESDHDQQCQSILWSHLIKEHNYIGGYCILQLINMQYYIIITIIYIYQLAKV